MSPRASKSSISGWCSRFRCWRSGSTSLLDGLRGRAAAAGRIALIPFVVFYVPYVAFEGIALGVLGEQLNGLRGPARRNRPQMVQDFASNPILGERVLGPRLHRADRRPGLDRPGLPPRRRAAGTAGAPRRVRSDRSARPAARPDRLGVLRRSRLDGPAGSSHRRREASRSGRRIGATVTSTTPQLASRADLVRVVGREIGLFMLGVATIALHMLDDSFLQLPRACCGWSIIVSGLVPLAVVALAAWTYPQVRGGRRGAMALVFGVFGIVTGIEAVHYTAKVGPSGDDYTGLLAIPAGLLLLGLGAITLWSTRRTDKPSPALALPAPPGARRCGHGHRLVRRRVPERGVPLYAPGARGRAGGEHRRGLRGRLVHHERRARALRLVPSKNGAAVIAFPGRNGSQAAHAMLARHGYGVLLFDPPRPRRERGRPARFRLGGREGHQGRHRVSPAPWTSTPNRIGGLGLSNRRRARLLRAAAETDDLKGGRDRKGAGSQSVGEFRDMPGADDGPAREYETHDHRRPDLFSKQRATAPHAETSSAG